jgi:uncharacterized protein (DUF433 family)
MVDDVIISDPEILWGMPVIKGTRVPVYDLAASVKAGIPRDRILAAYPTIQEHYLDLAVAYAEANPLNVDVRRVPWLEDPRRVLSTDETPADIRAILGDDIATPVKSGRIPRKTK